MSNPCPSNVKQAVYLIKTFLGLECNPRSFQGIPLCEDTYRGMEFGLGVNQNRFRCESNVIQQIESNRPADGMHIRGCLSRQDVHYFP